MLSMANMANQMELFDEGGLMDEGGTVDPVSGNDVPVGSTQEEVRDDIPAQLSEGEFVFPADVVRFIGLEKLMNIRQRAKAGLQRMDDMGQMGNSEEATIPDDLPFSLDDLDMEDDGLEMNQGGVVSMSNGGQAPTARILPIPYQNPPISGAVPMPGFTGISGYTPPAPVTTGFAPAPVVQQPVAAASSAQQTQAGTLPGTQFIPTTVQQALPTFQGTVGMGVSGVDYEEVEYVNDAGQIIKLKKSKSTGELLEPVPDGFRLKTDAVGSTQTGPTTVQTTQVSEGDGGDNQDFGRGTSLTTGEKIAGYSPEEIKTGVTTAKERFAITGNRGFDVLNLVPGGTFLKDLAGKIGGPVKDVASNLFGKDPIYSQDMRGDIFGVKGGEKGLPGERFSGQIADARYAYEQVLGSKDKPLRMTGYVGFEKGDLDPNSGGFFNSRGVAVDKDGNPTTNELGTKNFSSFTDFKNHMAAAVKSGWYGGELSKAKAGALNPKAQSNYRNYVTELNKLYPDDKIEGPTIATPTSSPRRTPTETERALGYPEGVTQRDFGRETPAEERARERANAEQAARQEVARARADAAFAAEQAASRREDSFSGDGQSDNQGGNESSPGGGYGSDQGTGGGGDMGVICLTEDMKVRRNGIIDFVTNVQVGDIVDYTKVTEVLHKHMREGYYVVNGELKITNDHPVLANGSWKRTEDLVLGDYINDVKVASIEYIEKITPTVYIGTEADRYTVYTEGATYTVHGQYKNALKKAA